MMDRRSWSEFREAGMLWLVNRILHIFGWAITLDGSMVDGELVVSDVCPARVSYRGFSRRDEEEGYKQVARYLRDHAGVLFSEIE